MFNPRPKQAQVLKYSGGKMGVSAVPGSGKTFTLSYLAAQLIASNRLNTDQEVLIVTLVNSAVDNFSTRISSFIQEYGLLPDTGYRVRTLHGLAHDIVRERPELAGLSDSFQILDEREAENILKSSVRSWLNINQEFVNHYTIADLKNGNTYQLEKNWEELAASIAGSFIRVCKDYQCSPEKIKELLKAQSMLPLPLLDMGSQIYIEYERALRYRTAIDFDDLIRLALQTLESDPEFLQRLRYRWPFILEDEAQDSNHLQEQILRLLAGPNGNWVRVGDPNQAIFETFTTAHPRFLRNFLREPDVTSNTLPNSGRSTRSIINLANHLISWSRSKENPVETMRDTLSYPLIEPTPPGDPQPNPPDKPEGILFYNKKISPEEETRLIVQSLKKWLPENQDKTVAVLVPRNERGVKLVEELKKYRIEYVELLRSSLSTRRTADLLSRILYHLAEPASARYISEVYSLLREEYKDNPEKQSVYKTAISLLKRMKNPEDYFWPLPDRSWLFELKENGTDAEILSELSNLRTLVTKWQEATILPIDQLILTVSQDLFDEPAQLALTYKLALLLEQVAENHPDWKLKQFAEELDFIAKNQRKFLGFASEDSGFDPEAHKGKVVISTVHKAKGLEWDRVYLSSVNNFDFPFLQPDDQYMGEKWFIRDKLNLQEETLSKLKALIHEDIEGLFFEDGAATHESRLEYASERLRLFFVGITRAKEDLIVTWNSGRNKNCTASLPFTVLSNYLSAQKEKNEN